LSANAQEQCDGLDNDRDGQIDEEAQCEQLDIVAFIVTDAQGHSSYTVEDVEREIERINRGFAAGQHELGPTVVLADVVELANSDWLEVGERELGEILVDPLVSAPRESFFVPVIFTDELSSGDAPKAGVATLPNGHCGGRRVGDRPEAPGGGVVVAKGRSPTTTAHEIGHFLGLCHTHYGYGDAPVRLVRWRDADGTEVQQQCGEPCLLDGDGICDTPPDPGPDQCRYDRNCQVRCGGGAAPDPFNVMSYYTSCRHTLSVQQAREMRRTLALRRGWQPCLASGSCPCIPAADNCPEQMTCRPAGTGGFACALDGPRLPGEACEHHRECSRGSLCANNQCRIPCTVQTPDCNCQEDQRLGLTLCR